MDLSFVSNEARTIHDFFVSIFYSLATILLVVGVLTEYFKMPLGGAPAFSQLIGRTFIAAILLIAYPEISNIVGMISDSVADKIGGLNSYHNVLAAAGKTLKDHSYSWTSLGDTLISVVGYLAYLALHVTVFFFDAAIIFCMLLLYIFSPLMIAFFILPQTAGMTSGLFRCLFEIAAWKIVFAVLGTLLWSTALSNFTQGDSANFLTLVVLTLMLALSLLLTPLVVRALISGALTGVTTQAAGLAAVGLSAGFLSPAALAAMAQKKTALAATSARKTAWRATKAGFKQVGRANQSIKATMGPPSPESDNNEKS
jgi:hypothetical protein